MTCASSFFCHSTPQWTHNNAVPLARFLESTHSHLEGNERKRNRKRGRFHLCNEGNVAFAAMETKAAPRQPLVSMSLNPAQLEKPRCRSGKLKAFTPPQSGDRFTHSTLGPVRLIRPSGGDSFWCKTHDGKSFSLSPSKMKPFHE